MSDTPREIRGPEDIEIVFQSFGGYVRVKDFAQAISLAMDAEAYGGQCGNFEDAHKWRSLSDKLKGASEVER